MQEEISLKEIIQIFWGGKVVIAVFTIVMMVLAGGYSFFVLSPIFEANSIVRIGNGTAEDSGGKVQNLNALVESFNSDVAMKRIIDKLELNPEDYSINSVRDSIRIEASNDTSVVKIGVNGVAPSITTDIANLIAFEFGARMEIAERSQRIIEIKNRMELLKSETAILTEDLKETNAQLAVTPKKLSIKQSLSEEPYLQSIARESSSIANAQIGALQLESEVINPVHTTLTARNAEATIELTKKTTELQLLENEINENQNKITTLELQMDREKLKADKSERILEGYSAIFISPAIESGIPVGPNKLLNILIAGIVGFILSSVYVFARKYLKDNLATVK